MAKIPDLDLDEKDKRDLVNKLAEKIKLDEKSEIKEKTKPIEDNKIIRKAKLLNETWDDKFRRRYIGPFQFLIVTLIVSEGFLVFWMYEINAFSNLDSSSIYYERIVVGSLFIAVLIAVLVIFTIIYKIKKNYGDCEH